jgi:transposase-like protein
MNMEIRIRETGQVVSENEFRAMHPNTSFPAVLSADVLNDFGADAVLAAPATAVTETQTSQRNGVVQDALGNWVHAWSVRELTAEEIASRVTASKAAILTQIAQLERETMLNRGSRELEMRLIEREAATIAADSGGAVTAEQVLAAQPYYAKLSALNSQIAALRGQLGV